MTAQTQLKHTLFEAAVDHSAENVPEAVARLNARWRSAQARSVLKMALLEEFPGRIAVSSSFGAESAVLLHLVSQVYRAAPVVFLDTGKHFAETLEYRQQLTNLFGLKDVRIITPDEAELAVEDADGGLHNIDTDACCDLRKTRPLKRSLGGFDAWITGRKRYQNADREELPIFEEDIDGKIKVNPLANWSQSDIAVYANTHNLPNHPLVAQNYPSIGCEVCTSPVAEGEDARAGRWRDEDKTECGIHITPDGKIVRTSQA